MAVDTTFTYAGIDYTLSVGASGLWQIDDQIDIDGVEIYGDITESGSTGTMAATGLPVLGGLLDQEIDTPQLDVSGLAWGMNKAAGIVTVANGDFTLGEDAGTVANTGGDYSASTQAADGFVVPVGNTDTIDFNDFDAVFGADGFDASAASGATIQMGSGTVVSQGDFLVHASATLTEETSSLVMGGGSIGTPLVLDGPGNIRQLVVAVGAYVSQPDINVVTSVNIYGNWIVGNVAINGNTARFHLGSSVSITTQIPVSNSILTIDDGATVTGAGFIFFYDSSTITVTSGVLGVTLRPRNLSAASNTITSGSKLSNLTYYLTTTNSPTLTFGAGCEIHGDVSDNGATGDILSVGTVTLAGTADQTWATATDVSGLTVASTKTAGTFTAGGGDITLGADWGTVIGTDGDYSASTIGCDGIIVPVGNTDTFDFNDFDMVLGDDGFDASAASGATILLGSGDIVSRGDFLTHASATLTEETATLVMDGGTALTPLSLDFPGDVYGFVVAESAFVDSVGDVGFDGVVDIYGTLDIDTTFTVSGGAIATFHDDAILTGGAYNATASDVVIANGSTITNTYVQVSAGGSIEITAEVLGTVLQTTNSTAGTINIVAGTRLDDVLVDYSAANLATIVFAANTEVHGDITETGSTGTNAATGPITLAGTANQTINIPQLSGATFQSTKSSGNIIPTAGDITQGGAFTCGAIVADAAYSDTWETDGYSLITTAGAYFGAGDFSVTGGSIVIGSGDYYGDTGGSVTIVGSSKVVLGATYDSDFSDTGPWLLEYTIVHIHVARVGVFSTDIAGNILNKDDPSVTIKQYLNTSMDHLVIADAAIPNSANSPSVNDYIAAEALNDYVVHYLGQTMIITYLRTAAGGFG